MTRPPCRSLLLFAVTTCAPAPAPPTLSEPFPEHSTQTAITHQGSSGSAITTRLTGQSIYNLELPLTDHRGAQFGLGELRGHPVLIAMFYGSCTTICPMLIEEIKRIDASLDASVRQQTRVVLITLDPEHDTTDRLAELAKLHGIDDERWHFARTSESAVRDTAALLGIGYQATGGGQFSHSANITLLNREGEIMLQLQGGRASPSEITTAIAQLVKASTDG